MRARPQVGREYFVGVVKYVGDLLKHERRWELGVADLRGPADDLEGRGRSRGAAPEDDIAHDEEAAIRPRQCTALALYPDRRQEITELPGVEQKKATASRELPDE